MHKFLFNNKFIICLYMFRALCAHHQEVKIVLYSIWYHHTCRWPSGAHVERVLSLLVLDSFSIFHSPLSYLRPYILLNIFPSKISTACSSFFVNVHASAPYDTTGLISVLYNMILVPLDKVDS